MEQMTACVLQGKQLKTGLNVSQHMLHTTQNFHQDFGFILKQDIAKEMRLIQL